MCLHLKERSSAIARQEVSIHAIENGEPCRVNALFLASFVAPITADGVASHIGEQSHMGSALKESVGMGWLIKRKNSIFDFSFHMNISLSNQRQMLIFRKIIFLHGTIDYVSLSALGERIAGGLHQNHFQC